MFTIHKFPMLEPKFNVVNTIAMPDGAEVLSVAIQNGHIALWAQVDTTAPYSTRHFLPAFTGNEIDQHHYHFSTFIGTVIADNGIVVHVFEVVDRS